VDKVKTTKGFSQNNKESIILLALAKMRLKPRGKFIRICLAKAS